MAIKDPKTLHEHNMEFFGFGPEAMKKVKICAHCGTAATASRNCCALCGEKLPQETVFDYYLKMHRSCKKCGNVLQDNAVFCAHCGTHT